MKVRRQSRLHEKIPFSERLKVIPGFFGIRSLPEPKYSVIYEQRPVVVREYEAEVLAQVIAEDNSIAHQREAFLILADYIRGRNCGGKKITNGPAQAIQMTMSAPVLQEKTTAGWITSIILPIGVTLGHAPIPLDPKINLVSRPQKSVAVLAFHGSLDEEKKEQKTDELLAWLASSVHFRAQGNPWFAQYNRPETIPFLKRNEIHIEVKSLQ